VLSNHPHHPIIEELLRKHDLLQFFNVVITSAEFGKRKPHPDIFNYTLKKLGLENNPSSCLMCGDEPADIVGGHRAGLQTILCERIYKFPMEKEVSISDQVKIKEISEILNYLI
jgi:FMN phosphatase YigB (HAD superfamily)